MGVPALFRWLSKKYPKIVSPVVEEEEVKVEDEDGVETVIPINMSHPNPNQMEFDNLYLDMNGIVHPCTHPEGKPAPQTEGEMMLEIFSYTERVVNMVRPRKLLVMAIDGVAPRAKMNQQRSRRFRSAREAQEKEEAHQEALVLWESMGKTVSDEEKNKKAWDSNAITPGTPFMDFLASSLRYWVTRKMNTDPGWKDVRVIISDASVPGEGEHKIMDYIRRQRSNPGHDPNTKHVIYGLDADLIMLALATHEPHFKVLREDVFSQANSTACRTCGQEGHYAAQCTGVKAEIKKAPQEKKPFIFLDVSVLREYLEVELNVNQAPFPFSLEMAIDDWVLLIFFVGNDFLPHLPSLEIREGAIDTLLRIWKDELPRMGGYVTNHGELVLSRAQIILEGLARREDEIFRRRREGEERQNQNAKRRKLENQRMNGDAAGPSPALNLTVGPRPVNNFAVKSDSIGLGGVKDASAVQHSSVATRALAGSNSDVVANRAAIRMANLSAAEMLKAEMAGLVPASKTPAPAFTRPATAPPSVPAVDPLADTMDLDVPGLGTGDPEALASTPSNGNGSDGGSNVGADAGDSPSTTGTKRKFNDAAEDLAEEPLIGNDDVDDDGDDEGEPTATAMTLKVNPDGTVEQEDTVKLWEPGYKERYYRQKFGVERSDLELRKSLTTSYVEGLAWVLRYYYQGTPSWNWYYPYHFAPFAADFEDVNKMDINFNLGQPFKPYEQLMGVFPSASRQHIPSVFHHLMTDEDSPIIDFYPLTFDIDMNGKRMLWQGVALLPFIDEKRLLEAMAPHYSSLTEDEVRRNAWGNDTLIVSEDHPVYPSLEALYGKKKSQDPVPLDPKLSRGISGSILAYPDFIPGSTYPSPLSKEGFEDIRSDRSLCALYFFPKQIVPHRSELLPGVRRPPRTLLASDVHRGRGRGGGHNDYGGHASTFASQAYYGASGGGYGSNSFSNGRGRGGGGGGGDYNRGPPGFQNPHRSQPPFGSYGGGRGGPPSNYNNQSYSGGRGGPARGGYGGTPSNGRGYSSGSGGYRGGYSNGGGYGGSAYPPSSGGSYGYNQNQNQNNGAYPAAAGFNGNAGRGASRGRGRGRGF
ncbi:XRN 5'-3' exonuclease N-terminus-domain-containing protein [Amylostereum chailletii]|nr:XRN 5'-3' exonuclease N-terminus-domain-containing protein [Amylostereum chailletii]